MLEFSIVPITTFVAMINKCTKYFANLIFKKDIKKYIPIFSVVFGIALGVIGFYLPNVEMGNNIVEAVFIGIAAGAGSTGIHQIGKQFVKTDTGSIDMGVIGDAIDTYILENCAEITETPVESENVDTPTEETVTEENDEQ